MPKSSAHESTSYLTPPQYAARLGVKSGKILSWIRTGEIRAVNTAAKQGSRPRWRISSAAIVEFESQRAAQPTAATRRRRQKQPNDIVQYF